MSNIFGIGNGFRTNLAFTCLKSDKNLACPSFFGIKKDGEDQGLSVSFTSTPSFSKRLSSALKISLLYTGIGNGGRFTGSTPFFNSSTTGEVLNFPRVPSVSVEYLCNNLPSFIFVFYLSVYTFLLCLLRA